MLHLRILGVVDLRNGDEEELRAVLAQPKRVGLLAYLALASSRGWQRRDRIMSLFWPEMDDEHARNALNQALFFLRRHLGADAILTRNAEEIRLNHEALWCDAVAFEQAVAAKRFDEAAELYRGELLPSFHVPEGATELERWIDGERQRLAGAYTVALESIAKEREAKADLSGAVIWWRRLAAQRPHDAEVALRLMRALAAAGDRAGAIEYARVYSLLVREELALEPDPEVAALANRLRDPAPLVPASMQARREEPTAPTASRDGPSAASASAKPAPPRFTRLWRGNVARGSVIGALCLLAILTLIHRARAGHADSVISIAVIPFENLTNDPSKEYLADIMTDELITELARYSGLFVKSRTSVMQLKGTKLSAADVAKRLETDLFVEGTLSGDGRRLQVTAQLIAAPNDRHLWAERYLRDSANVLEVENNIAAAIAREIHLRAAPAPKRPPVRATNAAAYALFLRGHTSMLSRTPPAMQQAAMYFRQSLAVDTPFAAGYAGLAEAYLISGVDGYVRLDEARDSARFFAAKAIALDSTLSEAHGALAEVETDAGHWREAEQEFHRAIDLGLNDALAHQWYAQHLTVLGRTDEALAQIRIAKQLDPVSPSLDRTLGAIEATAGIKEQSSRSVGESVLHDPLHGWTRASYARRLALEGKCPAARANIDTAQALIPNNLRMLIMVAGVDWRCGDRGKALTLLDSLKRRPDARARGLWIASAYNTLGQRDSVWAWLDSVQWNSDMRFNFRVSREWKWMRADPRYPRLLRQMGLAELAPR